MVGLTKRKRAHRLQSIPRMPSSGEHMKQHNSYEDAPSGLSTGQWIALGAGVAGLALLATNARNEPRVRRRERDAVRSSGAIRVERVTTINRPVHEVYDFWKRFENFPKFMRHLVSVESLPNGRSRWRAKGPAGMTVEWEAEMIEDRQSEWIAWRSLEGSDVPNSGSVRFRRAHGARGTELRVQMEYSPPAGRLGRGVAWLFGKDPEQQIREDLRRSKQL